MAIGSSTRVVYAALAGNVLVAIIKYVAAALSGSSAMLTEAIHSTSDTANQLLLLIGGKRSRKRADASHSFGYGAEIYFWTFVVAVIVLLAGGAASIYHGYLHVRNPERITSPALSLGVLALSAVFEGSSLAVGYREYRRLVRSHPGGDKVDLWEFIKLSKDPNLYESLLEDSAALIGLAIATLGVVCSAFLNLPWADGAASMAIGVLLILTSLGIARATQSLVAGESVAPPLMKQLREVLDAYDDIATTRVRTLTLGPRTILMALTIEGGGRKNEAQLERSIAELTEKLQAVDERIKHVYFDFADGARTSA